MVILSPKNDFIVSTSDDHTIKVWFNNLTLIKEHNTGDNWVFIKYYG